MGMKLRPIPLRLKTANDMVAHFHRHHLPTQGALFCIGAMADRELVGAAIVGRPVARNLDDGVTAEVTRCVTDGTPHAPSMLYAACWRAWRAMGGYRLITYTLAEEPGTSLRAAGWRELYTTRERPQGWDTISRRRAPNPQAPKRLWEMVE